jgi:hypothetical protein
VAGQPDARLNARQCADIVRLIRHDHEFNAKARRTSPQPPR